MTIRITSTNFQEAKNLILSRIGNSKEIKTWDIKKQTQLHHTSDQWGDLGYFNVLKFKDSEDVALCLQQTEIGAQDPEKWKIAVGSLHGDLVQLLVNHFPEFSLQTTYRVHVSQRFDKYTPPKTA